MIGGHAPSLSEVNFENDAVLNLLRSPLWSVIQEAPRISEGGFIQVYIAGL